MEGHSFDPINLIIFKAFIASLVDFLLLIFIFVFFLVLLFIFAFTFFGNWLVVSDNFREDGQVLVK